MMGKKKKKNARCVQAASEGHQNKQIYGKVKRNERIKSKLVLLLMLLAETAVQQN